MPECSRAGMHACRLSAPLTLIPTRCYQLLRDLGQPKVCSLKEWACHSNIWSHSQSEANLAGWFQEVYGSLVGQHEVSPRFKTKSFGKFPYF